MGPMDATTHNNPPIIGRVTRIAHDHIMYASRNPGKLKSVADRLKITVESALAYAIADQICEEFSLISND